MENTFAFQNDIICRVVPFILLTVEISHKPVIRHTKYRLNYQKVVRLRGHATTATTFVKKPTHKHQTSRLLIIWYNILRVVATGMTAGLKRDYLACITV